MKQHAALTVDRWREFTLDQQILMIASEMHRGLFSMQPQHERSVKNGYERVLRLVDLTVEAGVRRNLRREPLRWRGVVAELYASEGLDPAAHALALRVLLQMTPEAAKQIVPLGL
ncbi:MAG: hypothetical protein ACKVWV_05635 [Planctomycetota bacterium]